ncbi:MAG TPA: hypothetical protein VMY40_07435 [Anaerolineae bacterium]|nr:hypothetical protein [Anaerolineae bacterium]
MRNLLPMVALADLQRIQRIALARAGRVPQVPRKGQADVAGTRQQQPVELTTKRRAEAVPSADFAAGMVRGMVEAEAELELVVMVAMELELVARVALIRWADRQRQVRMVLDALSLRKQHHVLNVASSRLSIHFRPLLEGVLDLSVILAAPEQAVVVRQVITH